VFLAVSLPQRVALLDGTPGLVQIEGAVLNMGARIWHGASPWPDPFRDQNISFLYGPLAPALLGGAWLAGGGSLAVPRLASCVAAALTAWCLFRFVGARRGTVWGLWSALAWLAIEETFGGYFFTARIDAISNCFIVAAVTAGVEYYETARTYVPAVALASCAILCRQTAVVPWAILAVAILKRHGWRPAAGYVAVPAAAALLSMAWFHYKSEGWSTRYILSPGSHAWALPEARRAAARLFLAPEMIPFWILAILGALRCGRLWLAIAAAVLSLSFVHASRWAGFPVSLAPGLALSVPVLAHAFDPVSRFSRWLVSAALIAFSVGLFMSPPPEVGWGNITKSTIEQRILGRRALAVAAAHPGPMLVNGFQEFALLSHAPWIDDVHSALGPDTAGDPALDAVAVRIEQKKYTLSTVTPEALREWARSVRGVRPGTAGRLEQCAVALETHYQSLEGDAVLVPRRN
jgi:hypothetical protein